MICVIQDGKCVQCGWVNWTGLEDSYVTRACPAIAPPPEPAPPPCPHLGPAIQRDGIVVKVKCGCSGQERDQQHAAHECAIHRRCLPTLIPADLKAWEERKPESDIYRLCHGCDRGSPPQLPG